MTFDQLTDTIHYFKHFCEENGLNFVAVGSVAYKQAYQDPSQANCDDLDCIVIYDDLKKIKGFPYLNQMFYETTVQALQKEEVDLFATKFEINGVKVSMDFISIPYFKQLSKFKIDSRSIFLKKMTDAEENPTNDYFNFYGQEFLYEKVVSKNRGYSVYLLPVYLFHNGYFHSGVLYNKFVHHPAFLTVQNQEILDVEKELLFNYAGYYQSQKRVDESIDIVKSIRRWENFTDESKQFIQSIFTNSSNDCLTE